MLNAPDATSTRPYLLRAMHEWCTDSGFTPYVAVLVDETVQVPLEYVKNGEMVLNVGYDATSGMTLGNEFIEFKARFGGVPRDIIVPINRVMAIYARENGQGMAFPAPALAEAAAPAKSGSGEASGERGLRLATSGSATADAPRQGAATDDPDAPPPEAPTPGRPSLKRIK